MRPILYTEDDLVFVPGASPPEGAPHLVNHWLSSSSSAELQQRIGDALRALDFDWLSHSSVVWRDGVPTTPRFFSSHSHPKWTQLYFGEGYHEVDPRLSQALPSTRPCAWSVDDAGSWVRPAHMTSELRFAELLRGCDIGSGVLVVLPACSGSNERSVVGLSSRRTSREWIDDEVLGQSLMLALCLHELLTIHMRVADGTDRGALVSPKRQEILRHLVQGQSNKQIAYRLALSADTVKYHLRELRRHFKVSNRMQLVNSALCRNER